MFRIISFIPLQKELKGLRDNSDKHFRLYMLMYEWVKRKQEGREIHYYFEDNGYKRIAIYGMNYVGETLVNELKGSDITIVCGIDKNADNIYSLIDVFTLDEFSMDVDAIIVTPIFYFYDIEKALSAQVNCPIISIEDVINWV